MGDAHLNKDQRYRLKNPEKVKQSNYNYHVANRDVINVKKKMLYQQTRVARLEKEKKDVRACPVCEINFRRLYLKKHLLHRHKFDQEKVDELLCSPCDKQPI
jgi:hypothetical protein